MKGDCFTINIAWAHSRVGVCPSEVCPRDRTRLDTLQVRLAWAHSNPGVCPSEVCPRDRTRLGTLQVVSPEHISIPGVAPLACSRPWACTRPWRIPSPFAHALRLDSALIPRWCAHAQIECAQLNLAWAHSKLSPYPLSSGEELGVCPSEVHPSYIPLGQSLLGH